MLNEEGLNPRKYFGDLCSLVKSTKPLSTGPNYGKKEARS